MSLGNLYGVQQKPITVYTAPRIQYSQTESNNADYQKKLADYNKQYEKYLLAQETMKRNGWTQDGNFNGLLTFSKVETHSIGADGKFRIDGKELNSNNNTQKNTTSVFSAPKTTSTQTAKLTPKTTSIGEALTGAFSNLTSNNTSDKTNSDNTGWRYTPTESIADEWEKYDKNTAEKLRNADYSVPETMADAVKKYSSSSLPGSAGIANVTEGNTDLYF